MNAWIPSRAFREPRRGIARRGWRKLDLGLDVQSHERRHEPIRRQPLDRLVLPPEFRLRWAEVPATRPRRLQQREARYALRTSRCERQRCRAAARVPDQVEPVPVACVGFAQHADDLQIQRVVRRVPHPSRTPRDPSRRARHASRAPPPTARTRARPAARCREACDHSERRHPCTLAAPFVIGQAHREPDPDGLGHAPSAAVWMRLTSADEGATRPPRRSGVRFPPTLGREVHGAHWIDAVQPPHLRSGEVPWTSTDRCSRR